MDGLNQLAETSKTNNLEITIADYEKQASSVYNREAFPTKWADIQNKLATAYTNRICGDWAENIEQAISCCRKAMEVFIREAFPLEWGKTQRNLAFAYRHRIRGEKAENLEVAIALYQEALQVFTRPGFPEDWAITQSELAKVYTEMKTVRIDDAESLEKAIACAENALEVYTREAFPEQWAMIQSLLISTYRGRLCGDRSENQEKAIACGEKALQVYSYEAFPEEWAKTQRHLGLAYLCRIYGEQAENKDIAIACCKNALQVLNPTDFPQDWAKTHNLLGLICKNHQRITEAIESFKLALEIMTPTTDPTGCFITRINLANTYFKAKEWSLAIPNYEGAIEVLEQSRSSTSSETRRQEIIAEDIEVYESIVEACIKDGQLNKAIEYTERYRSRHLAELIASNNIYRSGEITTKTKYILQDYETIQQQIDIERLTYKSRSEILVTSSERRLALEASNYKIKALESEKQKLWQSWRKLDPIVAGQIQVNSPDFTRMQQLIEKPTTAIISFYIANGGHHIRNRDIHIFVLRQNQISYHNCPQQGPDTRQWIRDNWLETYKNCYQAQTEIQRRTRKQEWMRQISPILAEIATRIQLNDLIAQHLSGISELILVPHLELHLIPFAALPINDSQYPYLGDKFLIRYVPSCQVLALCQERPVVEDNLTYGIVENATEDLPFSNFEGEKIAQLYNIPTRLRLKGRSQATVENYRQLAKTVEGIISSHHAQSRIDNPLESKLELADGSITLGQLLTPGWRMPHLQEVFLSCCETNLGVVPITDDILTLSTGFLCAGARTVVSTLWAIDDLATALFSIFYHQQRWEGYSPSVAIQQAQQKLRSLPGEQLVEYKLAEFLIRKLKEADIVRKTARSEREKYPKESANYQKWDNDYKNQVEIARRYHDGLEKLKLSSQQPFPFTHPFYWAAFVLTGE